MSRALGDMSFKNRGDLPAEEQAITALPEVRTLDLQEGDEFLLLATDGIWHVMTNQEVCQIFQTSPDHIQCSAATSSYKLLSRMNHDQGVHWILKLPSQILVYSQQHRRHFTYGGSESSSRLGSSAGKHSMSPA